MDREDVRNNPRRESLSPLLHVQPQPTCYETEGNIYQHPISDYQITADEGKLIS